MLLLVCCSQPSPSKDLTRKAKIAVSNAKTCEGKANTNTHTHTHTHTRLTAIFLGLPGLAGTRKVTPIWIFVKQETVSGSGIRWVICKSAPRSRQITTPAPHYSVFTGRMPFLPPNQQRQSTEGTRPTPRPTNNITSLQCSAYYFFRERGAKFCDECVCLSVCLPVRMHELVSETACRHVVNYLSGMFFI